MKPTDLEIRLTIALAQGWKWAKHRTTNMVILTTWLNSPGAKDAYFDLTDPPAIITADNLRFVPDYPNDMNEAIKLFREMKIVYVGMTYESTDGKIGYGIETPQDYKAGQAEISFELHDGFYCFSIDDSEARAICLAYCKFRKIEIKQNVNPQ
jgi:hypothetical protein